MAGNLKRLIVDAQLLQTSDRKRGMGLFLLGLLDKLELPKDVKLSFVTNARLAPLDAEDQALIKRLDGEIIEVELLHQADNPQYVLSAGTNKELLDRALASRLTKPEETAYFIPALFSSEIHPVFPSTGTTNVLLFHDIIPFLYYRNYFHDHEGLPRKDYAQRFRECYRTDLFVTNSQTTADDLMVYFGVDESRIVPILGAAADRGKLTPKTPKISSQLKDGFVFMPSGDDLRKNNLIAVQAFASLNSNLKLVVTSHFSEGTKRQLMAACPDIVFAGSVDNDEFLWFLDNAKVVYFPPEYEGLGMPILEAVERGAIVACSNIPVFAEISQQAFFYFDPKSVSSIHAALTKALTVDKKKHIASMQAAYEDILNHFSWHNTAKKFVDSLKQAEPAPAKKRLAIFCPSPSSYSAVGKYAFEAHAELSRLFDIDYYAEDGVTAFNPTRPNILEYAANYYPASSFSQDAASQYDHILYNIGNSEFHIDTILSALTLPANAIIHDTRLNGIFDWLQRQGFLTPERRQLEAVLNGVFNAKNTDCLISLVTNQKVVYCHSQFTEIAIKQIGEQVPKVVRTIHPIGVPEIELERLGDDTTVSFAGIISEDKGISLVAEIAQQKDVRVKVFGFGVLGNSPLLENLSDNVQVMTDLTDKDFQDSLRQTDILVNYRPNYHGETSRSVLEAMRHGAVVIVKDVGWYGELPDDVVVKVANEQEVLKTIKALLADPQRRQAIAKQARKYLRENYNYKLYAEKLAKELQ